MELHNGTSKNGGPARDAAGYISTEVQPERVIISQLVLDGNKSSTRHTPF
jgi:hypothetical protein